MNKSKKNKDISKYDGLIYNYIISFNYVRVGATIEDGLQDGRLCAWQASMDFKKRCESLGWDNNRGAEYVFVRNRLRWFFQKTKARAFKNYDSNYSAKYRDNLNALESFEKKADSEPENIAIDQKQWLNLPALEDKIAEIINKNSILSKQYRIMTKYIKLNPHKTIDALCEIIDSNNVRIIKKKESFFSNLLRHVGAQEPEFIKYF